VYPGGTGPSARIESLPGPGFHGPGDVPVALPSGGAGKGAEREFGLPPGCRSCLHFRSCRRRSSEGFPPGGKEHDLPFQVEADLHPTLVNRSVVNPTLFRLLDYSDSEN